MRISDVEKLTGYSRHTLRFYEKSGLISAPLRSQSNYRRYNQACVDELLFIRQCQQMGFQLQEINGLLHMRRRSDLNCAQGAELLEQKLQEVQQRITQLQQLQDLLFNEQQRLLHSALQHGQTLPAALQVKIKKAP